MVEDLVVSGPLTRDMIEAGERLLRALDKRGWPVEAALWYQPVGEGPAGEPWVLMLASRSVAEAGPKEAYRHVLQALRHEGQGAARRLQLEHIVVVKPIHGVIERLARVVRTGPRDVAGQRLSSNAVGGTIVGDAYVYRMAPRRHDAPEPTGAAGS
jgi:hypothetical protein